MHFVGEECNMIEFAKHKIKNYDPDSGKGYFQLTVGSQEYISSQTDVVLINEVHTTCLFLIWLFYKTYSNSYNYYS